MDAANTTRTTGYIGWDDGFVLVNGLYNYCRLHINGFLGFYHDATMRGGVTYSDRFFNIARRLIIPGSCPANLHFSAISARLDWLRRATDGPDAVRGQPVLYLCMLFTRLDWPRNASAPHFLSLSSFVHLLHPRTCTRPATARNTKCIDGAISGLTRPDLRRSGALSTLFRSFWLRPSSGPGFEALRRFLHIK